ncbi:mRNA splicing factor [Striga asiatica]|uniref:mRNA splicing factor n=1 Tax=Striga asiatica TaxID=4170 RepID=A0A5A7QCT2_STRAF|nr:mRNA splicing factor [Striga asiatica]
MMLLKNNLFKYARSPVVSFRYWKTNGYGFCEYKDGETAVSARRNLQGYEINGRQLRVDFAENDKNADRNREQGGGGPGIPSNVDPLKQLGGPAGQSSLHQPMGDSVAVTAATVMAGALGSGRGSVVIGQSRVVSDTMDQVNRASKLVKLNGSQALPSSRAVNIVTRFPTSNIPGRQAPRAEETLKSDKQQATQLQVPSDVNRTLLQQVLSLTQEQLSSLPPDQQQQLIQLQQMLWQAT